MKTKEKIKNITQKVKKEKENKKTIFSFKVFLFFLIPLVVIMLAMHGVNYIFTKIAPAHTYFFDKDISFKTKQQVEEIVQNEKDKVLKTQVVFTVEDDQSNKIIKNFYLSKVVNDDLADDTIKNIFSNFSNTKIDIQLFIENLFRVKKYKFDNYSLNREEIKTIKDEIRKGEKVTVNAAIVKDENKDRFTIKKEEVGYSYDLDKLDESIDEYIKTSERQNLLNILIVKNENLPQITSESLNTTLEQANNLLSIAPINLYYREDKLKLEKKDLINMLSFEYSLDDKNNFEEVSIKLDHENIFTFLDKIAEEKDTDPENGELVIENDKAVKFTPIKKGYYLDKEDSFDKLQNGILTSQKDIYLTVKESIPSEANSEVVKYGLLEKLATGVSNFKGSSSNRIHNIKVGSSYVQGTLVKPGEEFSLLKTLKSPDASMGYVPELVIKGNKTEYEYGGGLCQVATTTFRMAIDGGFPITERKNHSYRVSYYEPAGTDATIYFPGPDFKFLNDTSNYIIITTDVNTRTNNLTFEIWGTSDHRKVTIGEPIITNIVLAPGTKWVESTDIPVDSVKCTESAHNGADAQFTYTVEYANGETKETVFKSRYVPWQAVCLKGVEKLSEEGEGENTNSEKNK